MRARLGRARAGNFRYLGRRLRRRRHLFARSCGAALLRDIDRRRSAPRRQPHLLPRGSIPALFGRVADGLAAHGLNAPGAEGSFARIVVEKPFGSDLQSAHELDAELHACFKEEQIFRIDHYMGKETVQNVLALRFANSIFEPIWNRRYVDNVQVTVAESLGVEHRGSFYETAGALRDIVQNHVMQVLALTLMEPPPTMDATSIRDEKVKLLRSLVVPVPTEASRRTSSCAFPVRAKGWIDGQDVPAYREEDGVDPRSETETYVAMHLAVDNWRWAGTPVFVRTGKRLKRRATAVTTVFQRPPHLPFTGKLTKDLRPDALQPFASSPTRASALAVRRRRCRDRHSGCEASRCTSPTPRPSPERPQTPTNDCCSMR